jgi:BirA family transcriptional regulator, biotin operon repressor / biotin---[acetyl-CoA-carboxylase] ligase
VNIDRVRQSFPARRIDYYPTVDSTMHAAAGLERGAVVIAGRQTAGLGRLGHSWHSPAASGLYCSLVLAPTPLLTLALGLAVAHSLGIPCDLRWPNDVLLNRKKVAGILVQLSGGHAIAGIGINVSHTSFPRELAAEATSLALEGSSSTREDLLIALLPAIDRFTALPPNEILKLFTRASSYAFGCRVAIRQPDGVIEGVTAGLNQDGFLIVRRDDGTATLILAGGVRAARS